MTQATEYIRQYSFSAFQTANPDDPLPAVKVDLEFNTIKTTLDQLRANLALIQRDDGEIGNSLVGVEQMDGFLISLAFDRPSNWATATAYKASAAVFQSNKLYIALVAHTSGTFATDLAALKWVETIDFTSLLTAAEVEADAAAASAAAAAASAADSAASAAVALPIAGGTMTGQIVTSADATLATHAPRLSQVQSGVAQHSASVGGTVDAITVTHSPARGALVAGVRGTFTATGANTITNPTMDSDGFGAKTFLKNNLQALAVGDIAGAGHEVEWEYNGTNLILLNPSSALAYTVNGQTQETVPATGDFLGGYDISAAAGRKFSIQDTLEVLNLLAEDTSPDEAADFLLSFDTSAGTVKKVKPSNLEITSSGLAKCWAFVTVSGGVPTLQTSYNITSITDSAQGKLTVTIATDFSTANWAGVALTATTIAASARSTTEIADTAKTAGAVLLGCMGTDGSYNDPVSWSFTGFGVQ